MPLQPGTRLGAHEILSLIGRGGMGEVYRARDTVLDRTVALKVLPAESTGDAQSARQLLREARAASALSHPNIVTIHAVEQQDDLAYIVMEHVRGDPLVVPAGGLPLDRALDYACQIAGAIAAAHEAGVVHRDLKPANVIVGPGGQIKVLDFGIARRTVLAGEDTRQLTIDRTIAAPGVLVGTVGYLSPEQIAGQPADARSDVFSLGVLMFEMLTGCRPFQGDSVWAVLDSTLRSEAPPLATTRRDAPPELARIVARALARDPADRYPSARELYSDLDALRTRRAQRERRSTSAYTRAATVLAGVAVLAAASALVWLGIRDAKARWARDVAIPEISRALNAGEAMPAYRLAQKALQAAPDDPQVKEAWAQVARSTPITSTPAGADVAFRDYSGKDQGWIHLGTTPMTARRPMALLRFRFTKAGYEPAEVAPTGPLVTVALVPSGKGVPGMVLAPAGEFELESQNRSVSLESYWIDKYEVTNREFRRFIDEGGYRDRRFWAQQFVKNGRTLAWEDAMNEFRDTTGRPGPSTWELGTYPDGQDDWPVNGVSWYEAAAYAAWAGKQLPTVYHWYYASGAAGLFSEILQFSNFGGKGTTRVGSTGALGPYGTYDMAGNVKEWCWNDTGRDRRYVLGGGYLEPTYQFHDMDAQPPFERRAGFGFRCMRPPQPVGSDLLAPLPAVERDPATLKPVGNDVYEAYRHLYDYDPVPLDSRVEDVDDTNPAWRKERVTFRATYGNERVPVYLFIPRGTPRRYQAVIYFPGSDAVRLPSSHDMWLRWIEFIVRSGRVIVYPVYQQTYERRVPVQRGQAFLREISIQRGLDLRRTVDYLQTRPDIDHDRIAFYGLSLGAQLAPVYLAIEPRLRTGVMLSGGFETWTIPPETDPVNFAPRVRQPVLMVNGREDFDLPYETAQIPLFQMLGTKASDKRHVVLEGGHMPPKPQPVYKEILDWLDKYLGPAAPGSAARF